MVLYLTCIDHSLDSEENLYAIHNMISASRGTLFVNKVDKLSSLTSIRVGRIVGEY